jgi:hypothetical protein
LNEVKIFVSYCVSFEEDLEFPGSVSEVNKANCAFSSVRLHEATDGDFASNKVGSFGLDFA